MPSALAAALAGALAGAAALAAPAPASAQGAIWRLEQPPPPAGAQFKVPLGPPGDLQFISRNRGILATEGNATVPRGLFTWNGESWRQLSTVCGGPGDSARVAFAGPAEFWTVSEPSRPRFGAGTALCHFKDGQVVASYSTPAQSSDPYRPMSSATCSGPSDCWFGGVGSQDATGERRGAFHLHWDGTALRTVYNPQGRGVSDMESHRGRVFESVLRGRSRESAEPAELSEPEPTPRLLHRLAGEIFSNDPFAPATDADATEMLALDSDGSQLWASGGAAASGPDLPEPEPDQRYAPRRPIVARLEGHDPARPASGSFREIPLLDDPAAPLSTSDRFVDVAAVPGASTAWAAVQPFRDRRSANAEARVARIDADTGEVRSFTLPASGSGRGAAAKVAFTAPADGWLVTYAGWLFHYTDGSRPPRSDDPAYAGTITFRPNEAAEQFVPDAPPVDDSQLFAPPPLEVQQPPAPAAGEVLPALMRNIRTRLRGVRLEVRFRLMRRARIGLVASRRGRTVARRRGRMLRPGRHVLRLRLSRRRWPTRLRFVIREPGVSNGGGGTGDTVTTGGDAGPGGAGAEPTGDPGTTIIARRRAAAR